jgi:hypothetical protein
MSEEIIMAMGAFCVFFVMWVVLPTVIKNRKSQEKEEE